MIPELGHFALILALLLAVDALRDWAPYALLVLGAAALAAYRAAVRRAATSS